MCECVFGEPSCLDVLGESMIFFRAAKTSGVLVVQLVGFISGRLRRMISTYP